jgi:AcrR family transcriptional regulator
MLVHHFGSRDALIAAALAHARSQLLNTCRTQLYEQNPRDLRGLIKTLRAARRRSRQSSLLPALR